MNFKTKLDQLVADFSKDCFYLEKKIVPFLFFSLFLSIISMFILLIRFDLVSAILSFVSVMMGAFCFYKINNLKAKRNKLIREINFFEAHKILFSPIRVQLMVLFFFTSLFFLLIFFVNQSTQLSQEEASNAVNGFSSFILVGTFFCLLFQFGAISDLYEEVKFFKNDFTNLSAEVERHKKELKKAGLIK